MAREDTCEPTEKARCGIATIAFPPLGSKTGQGPKLPQTRPSFFRSGQDFCKIYLVLKGNLGTQVINFNLFLHARVFLINIK